MHALLIFAAASAPGAAAATPSPPPFVRLPTPAGGIPVPTPQQLAYQGEISALIHFGMATFFHDGDPGCTAKNWHGCDTNGGLTTCNSSDVASFNPTALNISAWVDSFKDLGATSAVLTAKVTTASPPPLLSPTPLFASPPFFPSPLTPLPAASRPLQHGCGFLGWRTNTTLPDGTPYRYHVPEHLPVVETFVAESRAAGIGTGFYYSLTNNFYLNVRGHKANGPRGCLPGQACVTQAQFEALALAQVEELWTKFGDLTEIWLDGGCGAMCDKVGALVKQTNAAKAVAFNGGGVSDSPVRWCGTEGGNPKAGPGRAVWSTAACGWCPAGSGSGAPPNTSNAIWYQPQGGRTTVALLVRVGYLGCLSGASAGVGLGDSACRLLAIRLCPPSTLPPTGTRQAWTSPCSGATTGFIRRVTP
jgi:hypothetical protein